MRFTEDEAPMMLLHLRPDLLKYSALPKIKSTRISPEILESTSDADQLMSAAISNGRLVSKCLESHHCPKTTSACAAHLVLASWVSSLKLQFDKSRMGHDLFNAGCLNPWYKDKILEENLMLCRPWPNILYENRMS
jgi:hypothetical protein